jgi:hypothetical protein
VEFHVRTQKNALNRFILRQSKKFLQQEKACYFNYLIFPLSSFTHFPTNASKESRQRNRSRCEGLPLAPKNSKN